MQTEFWKNKKVCITGGDGFLGKNLVKKLKETEAIIFIPKIEKYDLRKMEDCMKAIQGQEIVIHLAGVLGGIEYNKEKQGEIYFDNISINTNVIEAARINKVKKIVCMSSASAYPFNAKIPLKEENLFDGSPEQTKKVYGLTKRMLVVQAQVYKKQYEFNITPLLLFNMYGPWDNFSEEASHIIPSLIKKHLEQKIVEVLGNPDSTRSFLFVEDAADAIISATEKYNSAEPINICSSEEITIKELVELIGKLTNFKGKLIWKNKDEKISKRFADLTKMKKYLGFEAKTSLREGLRRTIEWYKNQEGLKC